MARRQVITAPCKVNLHLGVYDERDERGYHRVDSVMVGISLFNVVTIEDADDFSLTFSPAIDHPYEKSAAMRAARMLADELGRPLDVRILVERSIPEMGGLGSSSADAGGILRGLSERWGLEPLDERVVAIAKRVGADVPFCLNPVPALFTGAGDVLERMFPVVADVPVVIVMPAGSGSSTRDVYDEFDRRPTVPADPTAICDALAAGDVAGVAAHLSNNLAPAAARLQPVILECEQWLLSQRGVMAGQVTGSGSCSFAICESMAAAEAIARAAREEHDWWAKAVTTVGLGPRFC